MPRKRQGCALAARRAATIGEYFAQSPIDLPVAGDELPADRAQKIVRAQHFVAGYVCMDYPAAGIDKEDSGAETVQRVGKCRGFGLPGINRPVDEQRPVGMRHDLRDAPPHFIVEHPRARENRKENRRIRSRFFQQRVCNIDTTLGSQPLLIEGPLAVFVIVDEVRNAHDLPEGRQADERIESGIRFRVKLDIVWIDAVVIKRTPTVTRQILRDKSAAPASDEIVDADDDVIPQCGFERRVIDFPDEIGKFSGSVHRADPSRSWPSSVSLSGLILRSEDMLIETPP